MRVELLGRDGPLDWEQAGSGIKVRFGALLPDGPAVSLRFTPAPAAL